MHEPIQPTRDESDRETHPAWALIAAHRVNSTPGAVLFDSDIKHSQSIVVSVSTASRRRDLSRDWLLPEKEFLEIQMSEAQWASFVSSMNSGSGVPCTIRRREDVWDVPGVPYEPRLQESMDEVRGAGDEALKQVREAFEAYKEKKNAGNLRSLQAAIENAVPNMAFAASSLNEHAENVVEKARADIEAMVLSQAKRLGIEPGDLSDPAQLMAPDDTSS